MRLFAGTSGFSYKAWKGPFYPTELSDRDMLAHYATRLAAVEVNNTFYRMPRASVMASWAEQVAPEFVFVIKAPRRITHLARLNDVVDPVAHLWSSTEPLGVHRGPVLFQLPPSFKKDAQRLQAFLSQLPEGMRAVFEFRHPSWHDEQTHALLREARAALCFADDDQERSGSELVPTADWGYVRLRREDYGPRELDAWVARITAQPWSQVFVFFKHEDAGAAPRLALELQHRFDADSDDP